MRQGLSQWVHQNNLIRKRDGLGENASPKGRGGDEDDECDCNDSDNGMEWTSSMEVEVKEPMEVDNHMEVKDECMEMEVENSRENGNKWNKDPH